jgi:hypothetical protein
VKSISSSFPTVWHNATKFGVNQVLMAITMASISVINRIYRIAVFSGDGLVKVKLKNLEDLLKAQDWTDVEVSYLGEKKTIPVYQYVCYVISYEVDAIELHKLYKQRSTSETWIEQVKGHTMAGNTLTYDFWANDILWQLSVFAYNISVMMRQKKDRYKKQEHRSFIDWFISVPAKITRSGHQIELKMYEHHFYKDAWEELDRLIETA